jgi:hypothetical protein
MCDIKDVALLCWLGKAPTLKHFISPFCLFSPNSQHPFSLVLDSLIMFFHMIKPGMQLISPDESMEEIAETRFDAAMDLLENGLYSVQ